MKEENRQYEAENSKTSWTWDHLEILDWDWNEKLPKKEKKKNL